jgi:hypothetical protein
MSVPQIALEPKSVPPEIRGWNWGAFLLNWIWGIGNNTFIALLTLVPVFGLIMPFVLGAKGNHWAWRNRRWDSVEHFRRVQRKWAIWGAIIWIAGISLFRGIVGGVFSLLRHSEAYQLGVARLQASPVAASLLGTPISAGYPAGSISVTPSSRHAELSFSANGPRASGVVLVMAVKKDGVWSLTRLTLKLNAATTRSISLAGAAIRRERVIFLTSPASFHFAGADEACFTALTMPA